MATKKQSQIKSFNVIIHNVNSRKFEPYDIIPYFVNEYKRTKPKDRPKTFEEFVKFVQQWAKYQYWARCEYEIILLPWPTGKEDDGYKMDVYEQIMMNLELITKIVMDVLSVNK